MSAETMSSLTDAMNSTVEGRHALAASRIRYALLCRRRQLGLTQQQVAGRLGVHRSMVSDWETGQHAPRLTGLVAWCDALSLTLTTSPTSLDVAHAA